MAKMASGADSERQVTTQASSVFDRLKLDILTGQLKPGIKLRLNTLIDTYDTGNSPLREALNRLTVDGVVVREENRGFRVAPVSVKELVELTNTRCWLEEIGIRESIANGDAEWEERIVIALHRLARVVQNKNEDAVYLAPGRENYHCQFHLDLISGCGSSILLDFCSVLHQRTSRYRNIAGFTEHQGRHELEEHRELQQAVLQRDADHAVELLHKHFKMTSDILVASGHFK